MSQKKKKLSKNYTYLNHGTFKLSNQIAQFEVNLFHTHLLGSEQVNCPIKISFCDSGEPWYKSYVQLVQDLWSGLYGQDFMVRTLWSGLYGQDFMVRTLWSGLYGQDFMVRTLWSGLWALVV